MKINKLAGFGDTFAAINMDYTITFLIESDKGGKQCHNSAGFSFALVWYGQGFPTHLLVFHDNSRLLFASLMGWCLHGLSKSKDKGESLYTLSANINFSL